MTYFFVFIQSGHIIHPADPSPWASNHSWFINTLRWRHNGRDGVVNHQHHHCLLNRLFIKENIKLRVTGLCVGNSPMTGEFPAQKASNAENVSIWWRHHEIDFLAPEYSGKTGSIPWLLLFRFLVSPGHQQSWLTTEDKRINVFKKTTSTEWAISALRNYR